MNMAITRQNHSVVCDVCDTILDDQLLFKSYLCQSMSMFSFKENLYPSSLGNRKKSLVIRSLDLVNMVGS